MRDRRSKTVFNGVSVVKEKGTCVALSASRQSRKRATIHRSNYTKTAAWCFTSFEKEMGPDTKRRPSGKRIWVDANVPLHLIKQSGSSF